jgi:hypothetical protein
MSAELTDEQVLKVLNHIAHRVQDGVTAIAYVIVDAEGVEAAYTDVLEEDFDVMMGGIANLLTMLNSEDYDPEYLN